MIDVTQLKCPQLPEGDNSTHAFVNRGGRVMRCRACGQTMATLRHYEEKRLALVDQYAPFHQRTWLDSFDYVTLACMVNSGDLDRPTLKFPTGKKESNQ